MERELTVADHDLPTNVQTFLSYLNEASRLTGLRLHTHDAHVFSGDDESDVVYHIRFRSTWAQHGEYIAVEDDEGGALYEVYACLHQNEGKKIQAIKEARATFSLGLKEAKDLVDSLFNATSPKGVGRPVTHRQALKLAALWEQCGLTTSIERWSVTDEEIAEATNVLQRALAQLAKER